MVHPHFLDNIKGWDYIIEGNKERSVYYCEGMEKFQVIFYLSILDILPVYLIKLKGLSNFQTNSRFPFKINL